MKSKNIKDIAKLAGVSYASVSRALNNKPGISEETRHRIFQICKQEGYRIHTTLKNTAENKNRMIGLIIPDIKNPFYSELAANIDKYSHKHGFTILLCSSSSNDQKIEDLCKMLIASNVSGIIIATSHDSSYPQFNYSPCPIVYIGDNDGTAQGNFVSTDNYYGGYQGLRYLYQLGHKEIIYFGWHENSIAHLNRLHGYQAAAADCKIRERRFDSTFPYSSIENGYLLAKKLFHTEDKFTAIFAASDSLALGVMQAAEECGLHIPNDFSLLGFDNISYSNLPKINLTTIEQQKKSIAETAVDLIIKNSQSQEEPKTHTHQTFRPELIERFSCRKLT